MSDTETQEDTMIIECPHCQQKIEIVKLNCRIFRCGIFKDNYKQVHPHAPKTECDKLTKQGKIYGCGRPFRIDESGVAIICDYI